MCVFFYSDFVIWIDREFLLKSNFARIAKYLEQQALSKALTTKDHFLCPCPTHPPDCFAVYTCKLREHSSLFQN